MTAPKCRTVWIIERINYEFENEFTRTQRYIPGNPDAATLSERMPKWLDEAYMTQEEAHERIAEMREHDDDEEDVEYRAVKLTVVKKAAA